MVLITNLCRHRHRELLLLLSLNLSFFTLYFLSLVLIKSPLIKQIKITFFVLRQYSFPWNVSHYCCIPVVALLINQLIYFVFGVLFSLLMKWVSTVFKHWISIHSIIFLMNSHRTDVLTIESCRTCTAAKALIRISDFTRIVSSLIKESL